MDFSPILIAFVTIANIPVNKKTAQQLLNQIMVKIYFMAPDYTCPIIYYLYIEPLIIF